MRGAVPLRTLIGCVAALMCVNSFSQGYQIPVERRSIGEQVERRSTADAYQTQAAGGQDPLWELVNQMQMLQTEVLELRGVIDQQAYEIQQLQKQQKQHYVDLDQRIEMLSGGGSASRTFGSDPSALGSSSRELSSSKTGTAQPLNADAVKTSYQNALAYVKDRDYVKAESEFRQILLSKESFYTPFAHYWLAEVLLAKKDQDLKGAEQAFNHLIDRYQGHSKIPPSLYKLGTVYHVQGETQKAEDVLNKLIKTFPGSSEAGMASQYLEQM